ncbi:MAG: WG repeat-containing protein [Clostridia bacterium]|nr:WG repeat-containing protein [Clostridia bacterium]
MRFISIVLFAVIGVGALLYTIAADGARVRDYNAALAAARADAEEGLPYPAVQDYTRALNIYNGDKAVILEYIEQTRLFDEGRWVKALRDFIERYPDDAWGYEQLGGYYLEKEGYARVLDVVRDARKAGAASETLDGYYTAVKYRYRSIAGGFTGASRFAGGYALVRKGGVYGLIDIEGDEFIEPKYDAMSWPSSGIIAVTMNGESYYINALEYKIKAPSRPVDALGLWAGERALVEIDGKFGYTDRALQVPDTLEYEDATTFSAGIAAVKKGGKWALIDTALNPITEFVYDDIVKTDFGTCIAYGVVFAKQGGKYIMLDAAGNRIGNGSYDSVSPFASADQPTGVIEGGKPKLIFHDGRTYENEALDLSRVTQVKGFSIGIAPAFDGLKWGYINHLGEFVIEPQFDECLPFESFGVAAVRTGSSWQYIRLLEYIA